MNYYQVSARNNETDDAMKAPDPEDVFGKMLMGLQNYMAGLGIRICVDD